MWIEVYSEKDKNWLSVHFFNKEVVEPKEIRTTLSCKITYVFAFETHDKLMDVTPRYCSLWSEVVSERVPDKSWVESLWKKYHKATQLHTQELNEFASVINSEPLPSSLSAFKKHHKYVLASQLLTYEAIYPPDTQPVDTWKSIPVFLRENVVSLYNASRWKMEGMDIKPNEQPYKELPKRLCRSKKRKIEEDNLPQETVGYYGPWQVSPYLPPPTKNGMIHRNDHGNFELFKDSMLPPDCVHLKGPYPNLPIVAKKLGIDCVPAMVGWEKTRYPCPKMDGYIVLADKVEILLDGWKDYQASELEKQNKEKEAKNKMEQKKKKPSNSKTPKKKRTGF
uniref:Rad4 beta-hairpin domain-containing protein n=1 Tax=Arcella intermedia TaxID=1963864 RepID=A0A6B2L8H2_9EUKA